MTSNQQIQNNQNFPNQNAQLQPLQNQQLVQNVQQSAQNPQTLQYQYPQKAQNPQGMQYQYPYQPMQIQEKFQCIEKPVKSKNQQQINLPKYAHYILISIIICGALIIIIEACCQNLALEVTNPPKKMRNARYAFCCLSIVSAIVYIILIKNKEGNEHTILIYLLKYLSLFPLLITLIGIVLLIPGTITHFNNYNILNSIVECGAINTTMLKDAMDNNNRYLSYYYNGEYRFDSKEDFCLYYCSEFSNYQIIGYSSPDNCENSCLKICSSYSFYKKLCTYRKKYEKQSYSSCSSYYKNVSKTLCPSFNYDGKSIISCENIIKKYNRIDWNLNSINKKIVNIYYDENDKYIKPSSYNCLIGFTAACFLLWLGLIICWTILTKILLFSKNKNQSNIPQHVPIQSQSPLVQNYTYQNPVTTANKYQTAAENNENNLNTNENIKTNNENVNNIVNKGESERNDLKN